MAALCRCGFFAGVRVRGAAFCACAGQKPLKLCFLLRPTQRHGGIFLRAHCGQVQRVVFVLLAPSLLSRRRRARVCLARATRVFTAPTLLPRAAACCTGVLP